MKTTLNVLLTGASGTIGSEIMYQLASQDNIKLTVFDIKNRRTKKLFGPYKKHINLLYGDISNSEDVQKIPEKLDAVIHLAAIIPPMSDENPEVTRKVNVIGTQNIIQRLEKTSPEAFLLFSSSISVYGDRIQQPNICVQDSLNARKEDIYAQTKIESEKLIKQSNLHWSIFRLTAIMKNHKISKLMFHMPLSTLFEICTPYDTAKAFTEGIYKKELLHGRIFNLSGGEKCCITYEKFLEKSFRLYGLGALNFPPYAFAQQNFHCGVLADGDILENILHFRHDTLETYFSQTKHSIHFITKLSCFLFRAIIKRSLLKQSEPLNAVRTNNVSLIERFFGLKNLDRIQLSIKNRSCNVEPIM